MLYEVITVPVLEIPGETVRQMAADEEAGSGPPAPPAGAESEKAKGKVDVGRLLSRQRSLRVREGPEGVSPVLTSYSIHYTKLYDPAVARVHPVRPDAQLRIPVGRLRPPQAGVARQGVQDGRRP